MGRLDGQVTLVTGGASGLGRAVVARFVAEGARVTVLDLNADKLAALADEFGERVLTVHGDVRSLADNEAADIHSDGWSSPTSAWPRWTA